MSPQVCSPLLLVMAFAAAQLPPVGRPSPPAAIPNYGDSPATTTPGATQPAGSNEFQPGIRIDWPTRTVIVDARIVLRSGPIEFMACFPGKEHESVVRLLASATHVYMAMGLIGLTPGSPPVWNDALSGYDPPRGDLVDLEFEWEADGELRRAAALDWVQERAFGRGPIGRPFVFSGSVPLRDGTLAADRSGAGVALVDFPDGLLSLTRSYSSQDAELWAEANAATIPPDVQAVRLLIRPAAARARRMTLDFRGELRVDGRVTRPSDAADLIRLDQQLAVGHVQLIGVQGALAADVDELRARLTECGVGSGVVRIETEPR